MASTVSFENISYSVPVKGCNPFSKKKKQILYNISGLFKPGMNAILGPTGSGKTTLLDILSSRIDKGGLEGVVMVDGQPQPKNFKAVSGYVVQDDLIMGTLTVRENVRFSANLRLPKNISDKEKSAKVEEVIEELGLSKCSESKIGTQFIRGVSGGERKRTSIAMELITSPMVLFLDEPTTGLDASTATSVMTTLKRLSENGRTVIFSIHQPRYAIFRLFDSLMLLSGGRCIYHGKSDQALSYFNSIGYTCEEHNNPPDFFLDVITSREHDKEEVKDDEKTTKKRKSKKKKKVESEATNHQDGTQAFENSTYVEMEEKDINLLLHAQYTQSSFNQLLGQELKEIKDNPVGKEIQVHPEYNSNFPTQLFYVSKRALTNALRSPATVVLQVMVSIFTAVVVGVLFLQVSDHIENSAIQNRQGAMFFVTVNQMFSSLSSLELFIVEKSIFIHESASGYYRVSSFFIAKVVCDMIPLRLLPVTMFAIISYFMIGFQMVAHKFFIYYLSLFLTTLAATAFSVLLSSSIKVFAIANLCISLCYVLMMLFGGFLINIESIVVWLRWIKYFSIIRYGFTTIAINEFEDLTLYRNNTANSDGGKEVLDLIKVEYGTPWLLWQNIFALCIIILGVLILAYIQLRRIPKHK